MLLTALSLAIGCLGIGLLYQSLATPVPSPPLPVAIRGRRHRKRISSPKLPRFHTRRKPDWVKKEVIHLYASATMGCRKLAALFNRLYAASHQITIGKSFVYSTLRAHQAELTQVQKIFKNRFPPPMPKNRIWALDFTGKQDADGQIYHILGIIDHGTRYNPTLLPLQDKSAKTVLAKLSEAIQQYGIPNAIRTDNEAVFHSPEFERGLPQLGIHCHQFTEKHKPWQNGRIERLFGTLKEKLDLMAVQDFADLEDAVKEFRFWYNRVRPHQHLHGLTPEEAWLGIDPWQTPYKRALPFWAWDGLLTGYFLVR